MSVPYMSSLSTAAKASQGGCWSAYVMTWRALGEPVLYLLTDHDSFYEHYGWEFYCMATGDGEETPSRMYVHKNTDKH